MRPLLKVLFIVAALFAGPAFAAGSLNQTDITNLNNAESVQKTNTRTHGFKQGGGKCVFDPSATSGDRTIAAHGCGLIVPKNAVVTFAAYKVLTTFTSSTDAATIAVSIVGANDVVSAIAISNGGNPWDAAVAQETIPKVETSSTWLTTTADSEVTFTVAVEALTAGKLVLWVEWLYYGDV